MSSSPPDKMTSYSNPFDSMLRQLSDETGWILQVVHDLQRVALADIRPAILDAGIPDPEPSLQQLEALGLVVQKDGEWQCTWEGAGVTNWRTQLHFSDSGKLVPEPREGENGHRPGPPCKDYRAALFAPGYCWCCRPLKEHSGEAVNAALRLLRRSKKP